MKLHDLKAKTLLLNRRHYFGLHKKKEKSVRGRWEKTVVTCGGNTVAVDM